MRLIFDKATESSYDVIVIGVTGISFTENGMVVVLELCGIVTGKQIGRAHV